MFSFTGRCPGLIMVDGKSALAVLLVMTAAAAVAADEWADQELIPARIVLYHGFGSPQRVWLRGRVLEQRAPTADKAQGSMTNLLENAWVLETDEAKHVPVELRFSGKSLSVQTDDDGMFDVPVSFPSFPAALGAQPISAQLMPRTTHIAPVQEGLVYVYPDDDIVLAISDFDDTVCNTYVKDKPKMLVEVFTKNSAQLVPVPGASKAYRAAQQAGVKGFFYVSGSPVALWDRLDGFLGQHGFPRGPIFLKNLGDDPLFAHDDYKVGRIARILQAFPRARFLLIGDSGERDPEIYAQVRDRYPQQVKSIVIRRAPGGDSSPARFKGMTVVQDYESKPQTLADLVVKKRTSRPR